MERRNEAGADERRLAASRRADDRQKPVLPQQLQELRRLLLAAEKQIVLLGAERTESRERIRGGFR